MDICCCWCVCIPCCAASQGVCRASAAGTQRRRACGLLRRAGRRPGSGGHTPVPRHRRVAWRPGSLTCPQTGCTHTVPSARLRGEPQTARSAHAAPARPCSAQGGAGRTGGLDGERRKAATAACAHMHACASGTSADPAGNAPQSARQLTRSLLLHLRRLSRSCRKERHVPPAAAGTAAAAAAAAGAAAHRVAAAGAAAAGAAPVHCSAGVAAHVHRWQASTPPAKHGWQQRLRLWWPWLQSAPAALAATCALRQLAPAVPRKSAARQTAAACHPALTSLVLGRETPSARNHGAPWDALAWKPAQLWDAVTAVHRGPFRKAYAYQTGWPHGKWGRHAGRARAAGAGSHVRPAAPGANAPSHLQPVC